MKRIVRSGLIASVIILIGLIADISSSYEKPFSVNATEIASPGDWISSDQIQLSKNRITIYLDSPKLAKFIDTNSMDPIIDKNTNTIEIIPNNPEQLQTGDIISYKSSIYNIIVIHRIVDIKEDADGIYFITKGDNNPIADKEKVRFEQIKGVVVGVIY